MVAFFTSSQQPSTSSESQPDTQDGANPAQSNSNKPLDVVFLQDTTGILQDTTGSQGPYIQSARKAIRDICDKISASGDLAKDLLRFGLIAFRDHPPQEKSYVTRSFGFTSDVDAMQNNLSSLIASGGGDGPEAQTAALAEALNLEWSENAIKIVILITDSPPHGIGERGDGFDASPDQNDPLEVARQMAERGITLFVIACEPSLSQYQNAVDFYTALVKITSGRMFPLLMADKLGDYIVGTALETIETEKLIGEFEQVIVSDVYENNTPMEVVAAQFQQKMQDRGAQINTMNIENVYNESPESRANVSVWQASTDIRSARMKTSAHAAPRMQSQYVDSRVSERSRVGGYGAAPPKAKAPEVKLAPQAWSQEQAQRVVMQSIARNSSVTPSGYVSKLSGKEISSPAGPF